MKLQSSFSPNYPTHSSAANGTQSWHTGKKNKQLYSIIVQNGCLTFFSSKWDQELHCTLAENTPTRSSIIVQNALLEKFWRISLYLTDDAFAKALCNEKFRKIQENGRKFCHIVIYICIICSIFLTVWIPNFFTVSIRRCHFVEVKIYSLKLLCKTFLSFF